MANVKKYPMSKVGYLMLHCNRTADDGVSHSNKEIDLKKTIYNYYFKKGSIEDLKARLDDVFSMGREDGIVLGDWVVTLPKNVKPEDEREFFQACYDFFAKEYGEENIINAVVHKDEASVHIHLGFVPVVKGEVEFTTRGKKMLEEWKRKKGVDKVEERLCAKQLINKPYLNTVHPRLSEFVKEHLGYEVDILNGATAGGNRTILELKNETLSKDIESKEKEVEGLKQDIRILYQFAKEYKLPQSDYGLIPLLSKVDTLEKKNAVLMDIIKKARIAYSKEDITKLRSLGAVQSKSSYINIVDDTLMPDKTDDNAIIIVDIKESSDRQYSKVITEDFELKRIADSLQRVPNQTLVKTARMTDRTYCLYKANDAEQAIRNLLELRQTLIADEKYRNRRIYMQISEEDEFYFAKNFLENLPNESRLYMKPPEEDEVEENNMTKQQEVEK
jgi:hypothetical protein